jgi:hypothetical protein
VFHNVRSDGFVHQDCSACPCPLRTSHWYPFVPECLPLPEFYSSGRVSHV